MEFGTRFATELNLIFYFFISVIHVHQLGNELDELHFFVMSEVVFLELGKQMFPEGVTDQIRKLIRLMYFIQNALQGGVPTGLKS